MFWFGIKNRIVIVQLVLMFSAICQEGEYIYPVDVVEHSEYSGVFVLYQKSVHHTELWCWHPETKQATKLLLSTFNPAGITILPDQSGFSFIDNNRVRIKKFEKRSPMALDFEQPIYDLTTIHWNDSISFYFSAKEHRRFRIYHADIKAGCFCIIGDDDYDALYPQRLGDYLYYVHRTEDPITQETVHSINCIQYPQDCMAILHEQVYNQSYVYRNTHVAKLLSSEKAIAFLHMISKTEGYYLEYPSKIEKHDQFITFSYCRLNFDDENWHSQKIFLFSIPTSMLINSSEKRLFESILPLLPKYAGQGFYFTTLDRDKGPEGLKIMYYDSTSGKITSVLNDEGYYFSPVVYKSNLICGGSLGHQSLPTMQLNRYGTICFDLPLISGYN